MRKVWNKYIGYDFFWPWIDWCTYTCYSKITVKGRENIPDIASTSVIFTPNHCNTLMDPMVLLHAMNGHIAFSSRADIFKKPFFASILNNLKIMPIYRMRDGGDSTKRNQEAFRMVVECLENKTYYSIFPEGTHRARRSLLPIKKGVFKIAEQARQNNPSRPVAIVPVGIEYRDYFNIMCPVTISFGQPLYVNDGDDMQMLASDLSSRIASLITWFPDDEMLSENERKFELSLKPHFNFLHYLLGTALLPFFAVSGFLCLPALVSTAYLKGKIKDKAWYNTLRFACKQVFTPFCTIGALIAGFINLPWYFALVLAGATFYAHPAFYRILIFYKRLLSK